MRNVAVLRTGTVPERYSTFANLARDFGIDLRNYFPQLNNPQAGAGAQPQPGQPGQGPRDPRVDQIITALNQQEQQRRQEAQARAQHEQQQAESFVSSWMGELDAQGKPKREFFNDVADDIAVLVQQIRTANPQLGFSQVLEQAYERATWANPDVRAELQRRAQAQADAQRATETQRRTADARRAASVNVPRRASTPSPPKAGSMDETLRETARALELIKS